MYTFTRDIYTKPPCLTFPLPFINEGYVHLSLHVLVKKIGHHYNFTNSILISHAYLSLHYFCYNVLAFFTPTPIFCCFHHPLTHSLSLVCGEFIITFWEAKLLQKIPPPIHFYCYSIPFQNKMSNAPIFSHYA